MSNYLPVLLVSVTTNAIPDDSALSTLPRGQVDYLSHEWQEEDVWRSWRNMTRQKNEIANGARLENASWRTWWKQRNKLKTVSPETLNWLKDSDVTWLYGPLHTAVEWTPPPKPAPVKDDTISTAGPQDTLDLSSSRGLRQTTYKPILKHRSISQLLTSDLPTSPVFSPHESEEEDETDNSNADPSSSLSQAGFSSSKPQHPNSRPKLSHTKSDTFITRYGPSRVFRKHSPPRIDPPGLDQSSQSTSQPSPSSSTLHAPGSIRSSISNDSNSSAGASSVTDGEHRSRHDHRQTTGQKKKHITFNTFVEQCIAIEKPKKSSSGFFNTGEVASWMQPRGAYVDEEGYEEDQEEESEEEAYTPHAVWHSNQQHQQNLLLDRRRDSDSPLDEDEEEDEEDDVIEIRSSYRTNPTPKKPRSQSKVSTTSSSSSTSTSTTASSDASGSISTSTSTSSPGGSLSPTRPSSKRKSSLSSVSTSSTSTATTKARRTSTSTYRPRGPPPPLLRASSDHVHVTIAPIAPTLLKTTPVSWVEGFGDESAATDDGMSGWVRWLTGEQENVPNSKGKNKPPGTPIPGRGGRDGTGAFGNLRYDGYGDDEQASEGTPVELVYVPPLGSNYALGMGEYEDSEATGYAGVYAAGYGSEGGRTVRGVHGGYGAYGGGAYGFPYREEEEEEEDDDDDSSNSGPAVGFGNVPSRNLTSARDGSSSSSSMRRSGSCSDLPAVGMLGTIGGRSGGRNNNQDRNPSTPIPIRGAAENGNNVPNVVIDHHPPTRRRRSGQDEHDDSGDTSPYGFFGGPDMGEDYFYARRGGRGCERGSGGAYSSKPKEDTQNEPAVYPHGPADTDTSANVGTSEMFEYPGPVSYASTTTAPVEIASSRPSSGAIPTSPTNTVTPSSSQQPSVLRSRSVGVPNARDWERERDKDRQKQRQRDRERASAGNGEERQGRSRSRSQSRTPSPAFMAPVTSGTMGVGSPLKNGIVIGSAAGGTAALSTSNSSASLGSASSGDLSRSSRTGSSMNGELLSPPQSGSMRGRGLHVDTSQHPQKGDRDRDQQPARGRSSARGSSTSSSWERERASAGAGSSASPMGSLSPDGGQSQYSGTTIRAGGIGAVLSKGAAVLASGGRERKPSDEKEDKRGRERRGRDRTSGKMLAATEDSVGMVMDASPSEKKTESPKPASPAPPPPPASVPGPIPMDVSYSSTTSSSSTSASTIVPDKNSAAPADVDMADEVDNPVSRELRFMRHAEEEARRRNHPTPSNSPVVGIRMAAVMGNHNQSTEDKDDDSSATSPSIGATTPTSITSNTGSTSPPPLDDRLGTPMSVDKSPVVASPPPTCTPMSTVAPNHVRGNSGSSITTSALSPTKMRPPPLIPSPSLPVKPSTSFTAVSSPAPWTPSPAPSSSSVPRVHRQQSRERESQLSPTTSNGGNENGSSSTIMGKAVDIVSSAGAFFGFWGGANNGNQTNAAVATSPP